MGGDPISESMTQKIAALLRDTDLTIPVIAGRFGLSNTAVYSINRRFAIRKYDGKRSTWSVGTERHDVTAGL